VREFSLIAKNYIFRGSFIFDFIAILPVQVFLNEDNNVNKIFRVVRITRLLKLLDIARFNHLLKSFFENDSSQDKIMLQYVFMYTFKITRLFLAAIIITYFCGCIWFLVVSIYKDPGQIDSKGEVISEPSFFYAFEMDKMATSRQIVVSWYYSMTTLTTVGYGDYYPISNTEVFVAVCYMLCGVVFFSYIMSSVIEIINNQ
jgi:hypothetical protein